MNITTDAQSTVINVTPISTDSSMDSSALLLIIIPLLISPFIGLITWYIRGYFEKQRNELKTHNDAKRKYIIDHVKVQIQKFFWPLHIYLTRYQQLMERYKEFKSGHFTLSSGVPDNFKTFTPQIQFRTIDGLSTPQFALRSIHSMLPRPLTAASNKTIQMNTLVPSPENNHVGEVHIKIPSNNKDSQEEKEPEKEPDNYETESRDKDIPDHHTNISFDLEMGGANNGLGLDKSIRIVQKFNQAIVEYEAHMTQTLKIIQSIYLEFTPIAEPDAELLQQLVELDEYITYIISFRDLNEHNTNDLILEEKIDSAKFPDKIYDMVKTRLHNLQANYNDTIFNHNSSVLEKTKPEPGKFSRLASKLNKSL